MFWKNVNFGFSDKNWEVRKLGGEGGGGQPFSGQNSLTDHKKYSDVP